MTRRMRGIRELAVASLGGLISCFLRDCLVLCLRVIDWEDAGMLFGRIHTSGFTREVEFGKSEVRRGLGWSFD